MGTTAGTNTLTATSAGLSGSPVTFTATGTPGAPTTMVIVPGTIRAPRSTRPCSRARVKAKDTFGNGVPGVTVTFAVASGGGSVTGAVVVTDVSGSARVGSWKLGPIPGTNNNTLTATASGSGIANNPLTFVASATP